jgi:hypothetical protein
MKSSDFFKKNAFSQMFVSHILTRKTVLRKT